MTAFKDRVVADVTEEKPNALVYIKGMSIYFTGREDELQVKKPRG